MEVKHEPDFCEEGDRTKVPASDIGWVEICIPGIKAEAPDPCPGLDGSPAPPDYPVEVWVPDIKQECAARSADGPHLIDDNPTQPSCSATSDVLEYAKSPVVQSSQLPARQNSGKQTCYDEGIFSDKHCTKPCSHLLTRVRPHTSKNPFSCLECKKVFSQKSNLLRHLRIHTGEKPFTCEECKKVFREKDDLLRHLKTHTGETPFACEECKRVFRKKHHLLGHLRTHTGEKPFACEECKKTFSEKRSLLRHVKSHTGEKPFACGECQKVFSRKYGLESHSRTHTREKPFVCDDCRKSFSWNSDLLRHLRTHHSKRCDK